MPDDLYRMGDKARELLVETRARRPEATITSWTELTPRPPSSSGTGAAKYPACRSESMLSNG